jgi:hypothetical protein
VEIKLASTTPRLLQRIINQFLTQIRSCVVDQDLRMPKTFLDRSGHSSDVLFPGHVTHKEGRRPTALNNPVLYRLQPLNIARH